MHQIKQTKEQAHKDKKKKRKALNKAAKAKLWNYKKMGF